MSVVNVARLFPKSGQTAEMLRILGEHADSVHAEQGCEFYAAHEAPDGTIVMIEKWTTQADLDAHLAGEPLRIYREARAPYQERGPQLEVLVPVPLGDPARGAL